MKVSKEILELVPYKPGKPIAETQREYGVDKVYKLASNENPFGISPKAAEAIQKHMAELHRYPDATSYELVQKIAQKWKFDRKYISVGNGSNEVIDLLIRIYCEPGDGILISQYSFVAYGVCAQAARVKIHEIPVTKDYKNQLPKFLEKLNSPEGKNIRLVFLPNPNNPTGTYSNAQEVTQFLEALKNRDDVMVIFDEAYNEFVRAKDYTSAMALFSQYKNIAVIRTFSKAYGLAGLRLGALIAPAETIDLYNRVRNPFNINEIVQIAAIAALDDEEFIKKSVDQTWKGLDYFYREFTQMKVDYTPSEGNFVMFDTKRDVKQVFESLLRLGVILRPLQNYGLKTQMRLSVGLDFENEIAMKSLKEVFAKTPQIT